MKSRSEGFVARVANEDAVQVPFEETTKATLRQRNRVGKHPQVPLPDELWSINLKKEAQILLDTPRYLTYCG